MGLRPNPSWPRPRGRGLPLRCRGAAELAASPGGGHRCAVAMGEGASVHGCPSCLCPCGREWSGAGALQAVTRHSSLTCEVKGRLHRKAEVFLWPPGETAGVRWCPRLSWTPTGLLFYTSSLPSSRACPCWVQPPSGALALAGPPGRGLCSGRRRPPCPRWVGAQAFALTRGSVTKVLPAGLAPVSARGRLLAACSPLRLGLFFLGILF